MKTQETVTDRESAAPECMRTSYGFMMGLLAGGAVGVGVGMLFAPRAVQDFRRRTTAAVKRAGSNASDAYHQAGTRVAAAVDDITTRGQDLRDDLSDAVVHGAQDVERFAQSVKSAR